MACIEVSVELEATLVQMIYEVVIAAAGDKERAAELFAESLDYKRLGSLARILFDGVVKDVKPWHSGYNIEFKETFATKHGG